MLKKTLQSIKQFIHLESSSGIILFFMAVLALIIDNSPWAKYYSELIHLPLGIHFGEFHFEKSLSHWVNDGLMAIFFFLVGLEIKREILEGELNSARKIALPGIAAIGGMLVPAFIYILFNAHNRFYLHGWAIPTATDIAFSLGVLSLLGSRVPSGLKIFLTALAILDDLGAIIIIAIFYTAKLSLLSGILSGLCLLVLFMLNRLNVTARMVYVIVGITLWLCVLQSGVHATLAGVALAMAVPIHSRNKPGRSPLREFERDLLPWVAYAVLPIFAFINAGVSFKGFHPDMIFHSIPLGIALGLFLGKQIGIFSASWLAVKMGFANLPSKVTWPQMYGLALICGIGFTMSLFIGILAFNNSDAFYATAVRVGVIFGSTLSGIFGYLLLRLLSRSRKRT